MADYIRLADAFPRPKVVTLHGEPFLVLPFRIRDLVALEQIAEDQSADPFGVLELDPTVPDYLELLRAAGDLAESPPAWGTRAVDAAIQSPAGAVRYLRGALRHRGNQPRIGGHWLDLALSLDEAEWEAVERVALALDMREALYAAADRYLGLNFEAQPGSGRSGIPWGKALWRVCQRKRCRPRALLNLTLVELAWELGGAVRPEVEGRLPADCTWEEEERIQAIRANFWGGDGDA